MHMPGIKSILLSLAAVALLIFAGLITIRYQADRSQAFRRTAAGGKVVQTPCGPIEYSEVGQGAPVLMIHGSGGGYDQGLYFARSIGGNFRWIAPSRFGYLGTPAPQGADSMRQAEAHACLLDALGIDRVGVVGVSGGGPSALLFAQRYPERTTALVMVDAVSHAIPPRPAALSAMFNVFLDDFVFWSMLNTSKEGLLAALGMPMEDQRAMTPQTAAQVYGVLDIILPMSARRSGQMLEQRMSEFDTGQLDTIQAPTLVVHARNDTLVPFDHGEFTARSIPGARLVALENGGHFSLLFHPEARAQVVEFLAQYNHTTQ